MKRKQTAKSPENAEVPGTENLAAGRVERNRKAVLETESTGEERQQEMRWENHGRKTLTGRA